ncbi:MAG: signal recognition particle-docking protein FtsY [Nanoarchaeota archaeon]
MFDKLKEKLKQAVSVFSRKTEEEAVVEEKPVEAKRVEEKRKEVKEKPGKKEFKKEKEKSKKEEKAKPSKKGKSSHFVRDFPSGKKKEITKEEVEVLEPEEKKIFGEEKEIIEEKKEELSTEKPSLFKRLFGKKEEEKVEGAEETKAETEVKEEVAKETKEEIEEPEKESFFGKIKTSLTTKKISAEKFEELFWELELALLENNVSVEVIEKIKEDLKKELVDKPLPRDVPTKIEETLKQTLTEILSFDKVDLLELAKKKEKPLVIAFFGINGTGKTTSIAKLAHYFQKHKLSVVLAACDTFRAAAIQQLEEHADKLGVKIIKHDYGADAAAVAFDAVKYAEKNKIDVVLLDTAGRLHSNTNLMKELEKIIRVAKPDLKIFVGESITGNDCIEQAKQFNDLVQMDGAILTKADVDEKGGAPLSISYTIKKPILFLGMGQKYEDLEEFDAEVILKRLGF